MFYSASRASLNGLDYSLFFLILSLGGLCADKGIENSEEMKQLSVTTYYEAWNMIQDTIASPTETSLQILLLHVSTFSPHGYERAP